MNSREHMSEDLERLVKRTKAVGLVAWAVAIAVMVYGTPIVFAFLVGHQVPGGIAWLLSLAADGALVVGLIATPVLAELEEPAGWVGTLRWVAGFITWALQTAGSWTVHGGPDGVGVLAHSAGPVLLFFAVEAASSFQRKVAAKLTEKARQLENAEQRDADDRAYRAEVDAKLRSATAELSAARSEIQSLTDQLGTVTGALETEKVNRTQDAERYETTIGQLRTDRLAEQKRHREELADARSGKGAVDLNAWRNRGSKGPRPASTGKAELSDEAAVQMMLTAHDDPAYEWSKNAVRTLTGVGVGRAPRLIDLWLTAATEKAAGKAVNE